MRSTDTFAIRLKQLREEKGLSQTELADKLGISRGSVSFYENGSRTPDIEILSKATTLFDVSSDYLIGKTDVKSVDVNDQAISRATGLNDLSIQRLKSFSNPILKQGINAILNNSDCVLLLASLSNYINCLKANTLYSDIISSLPDDDDCTTEINEKLSALANSNTVEAEIAIMLKQILSINENIERYGELDFFCWFRLEEYYYGQATKDFTLFLDSLDEEKV